jgi:hypothetical protein
MFGIEKIEQKILNGMINCIEPATIGAIAAVAGAGSQIYGAASADEPEEDPLRKKQADRYGYQTATEVKAPGEKKMLYFAAQWPNLTRAWGWGSLLGSALVAGASAKPGEGRMLKAGAQRLMTPTPEEQYAITQPPTPALTAARARTEQNKMLQRRALAQKIIGAYLIGSFGTSLVGSLSGAGAAAACPAGAYAANAQAGAGMGAGPLGSGALNMIGSKNLRY